MSSRSGTQPTRRADSSTAFSARSSGRRQRERSSEDSLSRAEKLLARLEAARGELEQLSEQEDASPERALEILNELSELAKAVEEELGAREARGGGRCRTS